MRCEYCQKEYPVEDERMVGKDINCPHCGVPGCCSDRRVLIICPLCGKELEGELWMLGNRAECTYCGREVTLSRPANPGDEYSNSYLPAGYLLGNYTIIRCIGAGGMGEVYLTRHKLLDRLCALKLLRPNRSGTVGNVSLEALVREAKLACRIHSPNIIDVMDVQLDKERNFGYIVMEYVKGKDVETILCDGPMKEERVLHVIQGVCQALIAAAAYDVVHRDIKPANILITEEGDAKLADLGIAKSGKEDTTSSGGRITGTVNYAAPEQLLSSDSVDCRADIYSLGATMYHMLSGRRPFEGQNTKQVISKVLKGEIQPLSRIAPDVSRECCSLVSSMMSLRVERRPANAKKLLAMVNSILAKRNKSLLSNLPDMKKILMLAAAVIIVLLFLAGAILTVKKFNESVDFIPGPPQTQAAPASKVTETPQTQKRDKRAPKAPSAKASPSRISIIPTATPSSLAAAPSAAKGQRGKTTLYTHSGKAAPSSAAAVPGNSTLHPVSTAPDVTHKSSGVTVSTAPEVTHKSSGVTVSTAPEVTHKSSGVTVSTAPEVTHNSSGVTVSTAPEVTHKGSDLTPDAALHLLLPHPAEKRAPATGKHKGQRVRYSAKRPSPVSTGKSSSHGTSGTSRTMASDDPIPAGVEEFSKAVKATKMGRVAENIIERQMEKIAAEAKAAEAKAAEAKADDETPLPAAETPSTGAAETGTQETRVAEAGSSAAGTQESSQKHSPSSSLPAAPEQDAAAGSMNVLMQEAEAARKATAEQQSAPAAPSASAGTAVPQTKSPEKAKAKSVPRDPGSNKINLITLLIAILWFFSGLKVLPYLDKKCRKNNPFVIANREYLNLAALVAGPLVFLFVELQSRFGDKFTRIIKKKTDNLPVIINSLGQDTFESSDADNEIVYYVRKMFAEAVRLHASDIFIDPKAGDTSILRFRVDGSLRVVEEFSSLFGSQLINVLKVAGGMDISERRRPQDGSFSLMGKNCGDISVRVATVGAFSGEKISLRILGDDSGPKNLAEAGLTGKELLTLEQAARLPSGMVLICGPTGSGKTTTLYALLKTIDYNIKNVVSIEDPIEHVLPSISQMEVNDSAGIGFAQLLRNSLRQNPDVICLGEIRDEETAQTAIHAAQTGHLIIATLHSNDNIGTIDRLANLNIPLRSIAGTLRLVVSQRLVRKLCTCKKGRAPTAEEKAELANYGLKADKIYEPQGCSKCGKTGYSGRMAVFDILTVNDTLREMLENTNSNLSSINKRLKAAYGGNVMLRSGYNLVTQGITSFEEVIRVTMEMKN